MEGSTSKAHENRLRLVPVEPNSSGIGHPYAPENWPNPGDTWGWKVGKRTSAEGHFVDRYLVLPTTFKGTKNSVGKDLLLRSKSQVERYIKTNFPDADMDAFFESFHWKIPSNDLKTDTDNIAAEVDQVLLNLKEAHEEQYKLAREALSSQKNRAISLYEKFGREKEALAEQTSGTFNFFPKSFTDVMDEIKNEVEKLRNMEETAKEVAKNSMDYLRERFDEILKD